MVRTLASRTSLIATLAATSLVLASCSKPNTAGDTSDPSAITNRPQSYDRFIAIVKLKTPALLSKGTFTDADKAALEAEQAAFIAEAKALSADVQVLYKYKLVLNGVALVAPKALESKFRNMASVAYVEKDSRFERMAPVATGETEDAPSDLSLRNSVSFIGGLKVQSELGADGTGVKVGIIDTGIDYTHKMFGGAGTVEAFQSNDPNVLDAGYPNAKVVGGIDLVGTAYNSASPDFAQHVPIPDEDPIDEAGHGTHVAGTVAGLGDGVETYSGVAPGASLYAIKVFGKDGSTGDAVIIASLEYAADPSADLDTADKLDVVNLSLGSSFGVPHILYGEAVQNLVKGGTAVVASAGNSGPNSYIVGAPSTSPDAISVAASIDDMDHNWKFRAVGFSTPANPLILSEAVEAAWSKPIAQAGDVGGKLVYIGLAAQDLTPEQRAALNGNVALIDRGVVTFPEKAARAVAGGAIGIVVANNVDGQPSAMGGDGNYDVPAIMISKALGTELKAVIAAGQEARIDFQRDERIEKPELIDTLTGFSSRGPRSVDGAIKPEISAPGYNVISARMGAGDKGVKFSGTSMAAPHIAGVTALLKQVHPTLDAGSLKSLLVNTARPIDDARGVPYAVAYAGAGRVDAYEAAKSALLVQPSVLSLGELLVETGKVVRQPLTLTNPKDVPVTLSLKAELDQGLAITNLPAKVELAAGASKTLDLSIRITPPASTDASQELDGFILAEAAGGLTYRVPLLAVANRTARIEAKSLTVQSTSAADAAGAAAQLVLENKGQSAGDALVFNLLGNDDRKTLARQNVARNAICDLESVGWRVTGGQLQIAIKLYNPVTTWHLCEASVLIDGNGDGVADQELLGTYLQTLTDNASQTGTFASVLTDANKMREIRRNFELSFPEQDSAIYTPAILDAQDFIRYGHSTIAVVTADLEQLAKTASGDLRVKVAVLADTSSPEGDDYLGNADKWRTLNVSASGQAYVDLPETVTLAAGETKTLSLTKGGAKGDLIVYLPHNLSTPSDTLRDKQAKIVKPKFKF